MKHKVTNKSDDAATILVDLDESDLKQPKDQALTELAKDLSLPGFRKGKVPSDVALKYVDQQVLSNAVVDRAVNQTVFKAIDKEKLRLIDKPNISVKKFVPFKELQFEIVCEILPKIKLYDYAKIKKQQKVPKVDAKEIEEVVNNLRQNNASKKSVKRAAKEGDELTIDFAGSDKNGDPVDGAKGTDYPLVLGSDTFIPGFEAELVGCKAGDEKSFKTKFPKDYRVKMLAGADVTFKVVVKDVKSQTLPKVDDEFAKKIGPFKTKAELEQAIKEELVMSKTQQYQEDLKKEIVDEIIEKSQVPKPEKLVQEQKEMLLAELENNLRSQGMSLEHFAANQGLTVDELHEKHVDVDAERRVQSGLVLAEIADKENISVTQQELEQQLQMIASGNPMSDMSKHLNDPEVQRDFHSRMITQKTLDLLLEKSVAK